MSRKLPTSVDLPLDREAKLVLEHAAEEADRLAHSHIGTVHLFLGLLREPSAFATNRIKERGVTIEEIRTALAQEGPDVGTAPRGKRSPDPANQTVRGFR